MFRRVIAPTHWVWLCVLFLAADAAGAENEVPIRNGFELTNLQVSEKTIIAGGPKADSIPSVDEPAFAEPDQADWVRSDTPVIGVSIDGEARCYPVHVMEYHQIVNDVVAGVPVAISYDPLTDTAIVYRRASGGKRLVFGVSGLVWNDSFLLFDRHGRSLWSQFTGRALAGPQAGVRLARVRTRTETFGRWLRRHPGTRVLRPPEPRRFDYRYSNYSSYWTSKTIPFPVQARDSLFHPKDLVLGVEDADRSRAYVASIVESEGGRIVDELGESKIRVEFDAETGTFSFEAPTTARVTGAYWFAWKAFHPDTEVWHASPGKSEAPNESGSH